MAKKPIPTPEELRQLLRYEPETGRLFWRERTPDMFVDDRIWSAEAQCKRWNTRFSGKPALDADTSGGYKRGSVLGSPVKAHRAAWCIAHGRWPDQIDHINGATADNRLSNLREVSCRENARNVASAHLSSSKYLGVCWFKRDRRWHAQITVDRKRIHLGYFAEEADAARIYNEAAKRHFGEYARLNVFEGQSVAN